VGGEILSGEQRSLQECLSGNLLFLSGCDGTNPKTGKMETRVIEQQINIAFDKVKVGLEGLGVPWRRWLRLLCS